MGDIMSDQTPGPQDERKWTKRMVLLRQVLRFLSERGPTSWAILYFHFDKDGTDEIGLALGHLATLKHIELEGTTLKITELGREQSRTDFHLCTEPTGRRTLAILGSVVSEPLNQQTQRPRAIGWLALGPRDLSRFPHTGPRNYEKKFCELPANLTR